MKKFLMFATSFFLAVLCPVDAQLFADGSIQQASKQAPRMPQCSVLGWCTAFFFFGCLSLWVPQKSFFLRVCRILEREIGSGTVWEDLDVSFGQDVGKREFS